MITNQPHTNDPNKQTGTQDQNADKQGTAQPDKATPSVPPAGPGQSGDTQKNASRH